jgi:hypothetical protein
MKSIKKNILFFLVFINFLGSSALTFNSLDMRDPGDWVGNGASYSENLTTFVFENLEHYVLICVNDTQCQTEMNTVSNTHPETQKLPDLLKTLYKNILEEKLLTHKLLIFAPQSRLFVIDGSIKIAITGLHPGDPIYINKDILNNLEKNGNPISFFQIVSILTHEIGHHLGIKDHNLLDKLGAIIGNQSRFKSELINYHPRIKFLGAQLSTPQNEVPGNSKIALIDTEKYLDLTPLVKKLITCPEHSLISDKNNPQLSTSVNFLPSPQQIQFWNVHWTSPLKLNSKLVAFIALKCTSTNGELFDWIGDKFIAEVTVQATEHAYYFSAKNLSAYLESCNRNNGECQEISTLFQNKNHTERILQ